ncbi:hypothetical protein AMJ52_01470 [candidate division TA06 bacterium DG_78]|uniref:Uncharacterized protein n=1 Tax=candidate division TA06 bacterium DG_78 TaxID=1703772 RepID=A0A0S7YHG1_UNCT6|nr:MAG: hypothetical protein AMJ52_01470 [candidate division TA06 bacterium DG_78]
MTEGKTAAPGRLGAAIVGDDEIFFYVWLKEQSSVRNPSKDVGTIDVSESILLRRGILFAVVVCFWIFA